MRDLGEIVINCYIVGTVSINIVGTVNIDIVGIVIKLLKKLASTQKLHSRHS